MDPAYDVLILGAGVSGLAAAQTCFESKVTNFLILEAKDRIGGRILTVPFGNGVIEAGAQWIHGQNNEFYKLVNNCDHVSGFISWEAKGSFFYPGGTAVPQKIVKEVLLWVENTLEEVDFRIESLQMSGIPSAECPPSSSHSVGSFLNTKFEEYLRQQTTLSDEDVFHFKSVFKWAVKFQEIDNGCIDLFKLSLYRWSEFEINDGFQYNNFRHGGSIFLESTFARVMDRVKLNSPVVEVLWKGESNDLGSSCITVTTENGNTFRTNSLLITFSIGVLQATSRSMFQPNLPQHLQSAIDVTGFGPVAKVFVEWDEPWWLDKLESEFEGINFIWSLEDDDRFEEALWTKGVTGFEPTMQNKNVLLCWVGGAEAEVVEHRGEELIAEDCIKLLVHFTNFKVPKPRAVFVTKWNSEPYTRGAYSNRSTAGDRIHGDIAEILSTPFYPNFNSTDTSLILFAGEACSKSQYSTVHGAYASGVEQANRLIQHILPLKLF